MNQNQQVPCQWCGEDMPAGFRRCPSCGSIQKDTGHPVAVSDYRSEYMRAAVYGAEENPVMPVQAVTMQSVPTETETRPTLRNGIKVLMTVLSVLIPVAGPLFGLIAGVVMMCADDRDRKSFGAALFVAAVVTGVLGVLVLIVFGMALANLRQQGMYFR